MKLAGYEKAHSELNEMSEPLIFNQIKLAAIDCGVLRFLEANAE